MKWEKLGQGAQRRGWVGVQGLSQAPDPTLPISALPSHHYSHPQGSGERLLGGQQDPISLDILSIGWERMVSLELRLLQAALFGGS